MSARLVLYGRGYCHLCDDLRDALAPLLEGREATLEVIDVDADPALVARYDELVPVLAARLPDGSDQVLCNYFLDRAAVEAFLAEAGGRR